MDRTSEIKGLADRILYGFGLFDYLHTIGKAHIIGSYKMGILAINDLDIDVENEDMSLEKLYQFTDYILKNFVPKSYEGKEILNKNGQKEWYFRFEKEVKMGEIINVDIWFLNKEKIESIEKFCDNVISCLDEKKRRATIEIKQQLFDNGLYNGMPYNSIDVYDAVINKNILNYNDFIAKYSKR